MSRIELVCFDLDDTLWPIHDTMRAAEKHLREWLGREAPLLGQPQLDDWLAWRQHVLSSNPQLQYQLSELRRRVLQHGLQAAGYTELQAGELAEAGFQAFLDARHQLTLFSDALPTLEALKADYRLAVLSNGNADLRRLGLDHHFEVILSADGLGIGKPHAAAFDAVLSRAGLTAERCVHIGDHLNDDVAGAKQAGLAAIWFNPESKPFTGSHAADAQVQCLNELPAVIASL